MIYRTLGDDEVITAGDEWRRTDTENDWQSTIHCIGMTVQEQKTKVSAWLVEYRRAVIPELEAKLRASVAKAHAEGWTLVSGCSHIAHEKRCCLVVSALPLNESLTFMSMPTLQAGKLLGLTSTQTQALTAGFDGSNYTPRSGTPVAEGKVLFELYRLGTRMFNEFKPSRV